MNFSTYDIINILSIFVQIPLIGVLFLKGRKLVSNWLMIFFFLAQVLSSFNQIYESHHNYTYNTFPYFAYVALPFFSIWGPTMYLYVKSQATTKFSFKPIYLLHFLPFLLLTLYFSFNFHFHSIEVKKELLLSNEIFTPFKNRSFIYFIGIQVFVYNIISIVTVERYARANTLKSKAILSKIKWTKFIIYGYFLACICNNIARLIFVYSEARNVWIYFHASAILFFIYFSVILIKALLSSHFGEKTKITNLFHLTKDQTKSLNSKLELHMQEQKPFLKFGLTLSDLATQLEVKERLLSQFINSHYNTSFQDYINLFRIEEAKKLIEQSKGSGKTILEIVYESGFNSKSAFNFAFKKHTNTTPTKYKKSLD